ncbi:MAG: thiol peroxidase [Planctomycetaceae bacterium]|jgi:thiol peroxidase|nr:thiol peroxidase [Planctomycetaceae bacterium]
MAAITLRGQPVQTSGTIPSVGSAAPNFTVAENDLSDLSLKDLRGSKVILNIFPSVDTSVCAMSVRHFNESAARIPGTVVLCISKDLPFAQDRFCGAEGIDRVKTVSAFRCDTFNKKYGLQMTTGPLRGLLARAVLVLDETGKIIYSELAEEIAQEPNYEAALAAAQ